MSVPFFEDLSFDEFNERRAALIDKELAEGLDELEAAELKAMQDAADRWLDEKDPIPIEDLSWLDGRIRGLEGKS